ncbi:hypothetical protein [Brachyspira hyodysenteriae]|nr:hypothetical protein [Brachyspira hyodysenteriae]MCZ9888968.1 hypothetical protein [Brachyspira hyodysenteriae]HJH54803.1 hypothetical protein [Brachyspira hyodysenteriae]
MKDNPKYSIETIVYKDESGNKYSVKAIVNKEELKKWEKKHLAEDYM